MLRLLVIAWLVLLAVPARADSVALLPLDGEKRLEIYGQPVASELARALKAAGVEVVVVGANMAVPAEAKLIVDGTIKSKKQTITLELRIRDAKDGSTLETLPPSSGALTNIDKVAADVSGHVVPAVKNELEALAKKATPEVKVPDKQPEIVVARPAPALPAVEIAATTSSQSSAARLLVSAFVPQAEPWATKHGHQVTQIAAPLRLELRVLAFDITPGKVPMARARVRLRVIEDQHVKFDRVIVTDTIVGDRQISEDEFAGRAAREVLLIAQPNIRRSVTSWQ
jgi:hypothetical protein